MSYSRLDQILRGSKIMEADKNVKPEPEKDVDKDKKKEEEDPEEPEISDEELERRQAALEKKAKETAERDARREQFAKRCQKLSHPSRRFNEAIRQVFRLLKDPGYYDPNLDKDIADTDVHPDTIAKMIMKMDEAYENLRMLREEAENCLEPNELSRSDKDYLEIRQEKMTVAYMQYDNYKKKYEEENSKDWNDKMDEDKLKQERKDFEEQKAHAADFLKKVKEQNAKESELLDQREKRIQEQIKWIEQHIDKIKLDDKKQTVVKKAQCNICDEIYPRLEIKQHLFNEHQEVGNEFVELEDQEDLISNAESSASEIQMNNMANVLTRMASYQYNIKDHVETFDSKIDNYPSWKASVTAAIETMSAMGKTKTQQYREIAKTVSGDVLSIAEGELYPDEDSLDIFLDILEQQFGQTDLFVEDIISQLMNLEKMSDDVTSLQKGWAEMRRLSRLLKLKDLNNEQLLMVFFIGITKVKITNRCLTKWLAKKKEEANDESVVGHNCKLEDYISVIQATLTNARAFDEQKKAKQSLLPKNDDKKQSQNQTRSGYSRGSGRNTMSSFQTGSGGRKTDTKSQSDRKCSICQKKYSEVDHTKPLFCPELKRKNKNQLMDFINDQNLCANCLVPGHYSKLCRSKHFCGVQGCRRRHYYLLHNPKIHPTDGENTTSYSTSQGSGDRNQGSGQGSGTRQSTGNNETNRGSRQNTNK